MTISEAIKILETAYPSNILTYHPKIVDAVWLGIEALKRELLFRERVPKEDWSLLPGETED